MAMARLRACPHLVVVRAVLSPQMVLRAIRPRRLPIRKAEVAEAVVVRARLRSRELGEPEVTAEPVVVVVALA